MALRHNLIAETQADTSVTGLVTAVGFGSTNCSALTGQVHSLKCDTLQVLQGNPTGCSATASCNKVGLLQAFRGKYGCAIYEPDADKQWYPKFLPRTKPACSVLNACDKCAAQSNCKWCTKEKKCLQQGTTCGGTICQRIDHMCGKDELKVKEPEKCP